MATIAEKYAEAIFETRRNAAPDDQTLLRAITASLRKRHHERLLPQILREYAKLAERKSFAEARVRVASAQDEHAALVKARELGAPNPEVTQDPSLIRGYSVEGRDFRFDASARRALINLYAKLTA